VLVPSRWGIAARVEKKMTSDNRATDAATGQRGTR